MQQEKVAIFSTREPERGLISRSPISILNLDGNLVLDRSLRFNDGMILDRLDL